MTGCFGDSASPRSNGRLTSRCLRNDFESKRCSSGFSAANEVLCECDITSMLLSANVILRVCCFMKDFSSKLPFPRKKMSSSSFHSETHSVNKTLALVTPDLISVGTSRIWTNDSVAILTIFHERSYERLSSLNELHWALNVGTLCREGLPSVVVSTLMSSCEGSRAD